MTSPDRRTLSFQETAVLLDGTAVSLVQSFYASSPQEAADAAAQATPPLVLKAGGLNHKSDGGGVVLGLGSAEEVRAKAEALLEELGEAAVPFIVQSQHRGTEVLLGLRREPALGAAVVVGMGGVHAEVFADTAHAMVPVDRVGARAMLRSLRGSSLLTGHRGAGPVDMDALCDAIADLSRFAQRHPEVMELDLNPVMVGAPGDGVAVVDARAVVGSPPPDDREHDGDALGLFVNAGSIAVVGAGDDPRSVGASILAHLIDHGFPGEIIPVHPRGGETRGLRRVEDLQLVDPPPDLVSIAVGAQRVPEILRQAAAMGCRSAIVHSSGFAEAGPSGVALQEQIDAIRAKHDIRVLGPNSMGLVSLPNRLVASLSSTADQECLLPGGVALVSSSGALGSCLASRLLDDGVGISHWVSLGNESDIDAADCLDLIAGDETTRVVGLVLERITSGTRFISAARRAIAAGKAIFAYQLARGERAREAAESHTGALVGSFELRSAVLDAAGVISVASLQVLQDVLSLAASQPLPRGNAVGAITASGGACTIIADEAADAGLELPQVPAQVLALLRDRLPSFASLANPLDATAAVINDPEIFVAALEGFLDAESFDALLIQFTTNADPAAALIAERLVDAVRESSRPVYVARYGAASLAPRAMSVYREAGMKVLDTPEQLVRAVGLLTAAGRAQALNGTGGG